jgi:hypothetical protein
LPKIRYVHEAAEDHPKGDKAFVYGILERIFSSGELEYCTRSGTRVMNRDTNQIEFLNKLDVNKLDVAYKLLCIRVKYVGINPTDRSSRQNKLYFYDYVKMVVDKHHQVKKRRLEKEQGAIGTTD